MYTADRPFLIEMIRTKAQEHGQRQQKAGNFGRVPEADPGRHLFTIRSANELMSLEKNMPPPLMLFGELWYQGELCILFADTNVGKSVLAVQIGNCLAGREQMPPFGTEAPACNVLYIDFELSDQQFRARYTHNDVRYTFNKNFFRAGFNPAADVPPDFHSYDDYMNSAITYAVKTTQANVLIVDNITCLRSGTQSASEALGLMKTLKALKTLYNLSILVLAHTPKRNPAKPLVRNDLQGSKMLINFADSAFAIGESYREKGLRYLKQVKQRNTNEIYGSDNVLLFRISKPLNFIMYQFVDYANERAHLHQPETKPLHNLLPLITELANKGYSQRQISNKLNIGLATVNKYVNIIAER